MQLAKLEPFLDCLRKSGLLDEASVSAYLDWLRQSGMLPSDSKTLAAQMVRDSILSQFQADQLVAGKWRGFHVAKYRVLEKIGIGGMGQVYLAEHKYMKHRVALKVLPRSKSSDPSSLERFYREAKAGAALDHPNLVRSYDIDFDQASDLHYLVMEYVDGVNMQDLVKMRGQVEPMRAAHYMYYAALGLEHAHQCGLIHRDIKPSNLLVDRQGAVKILDMGLARFFNDEQDMITKKYDESVLGTADYLAPEQAVDSHSVDVRADIYSLGCSFYFILAGYPPFVEGSVAQKLIWHQTRTPKSIREYCPDLPEDIQHVLERMMAKSAADRYQTPGELAAALLTYGRMSFPPPDDDVLPRLSPLARRAPGTAEGAASVGGSAPGPQHDRPGTAVATFDEAAPVGYGNGDGNALATRLSADATRDTLPQPPAKLSQSGPQAFPGMAARPNRSPEKGRPPTPVLPLKTGFDVGPGAGAQGGAPLPTTVRTHRDNVTGSREGQGKRPSSRPPFAANPPPSQDAETPLGSSLLHTRWIWVTIGVGLVILVLIVNLLLILSYTGR
ncbi:MAG TPA: protein kinase [Gemmatales bacterium]|nr:protein kinase [Gemmatales bacterium]